MSQTRDCGGGRETGSCLFDELVINDNSKMAEKLKKEPLGRYGGRYPAALVAARDVKYEVLGTILKVSSAEGVTARYQEGHNNYSFPALRVGLILGLIRVAQSHCPRDSGEEAEPRAVQAAGDFVHCLDSTVPRTLLMLHSKQGRVYITMVQIAGDSDASKRLLKHCSGKVDKRNVLAVAQVCHFFARRVGSTPA